MGEKDGFYKSVFLIASIYDLILGVMFFFFYKNVFSYFDIVLPSEPMYLQMSAAFVMAMGIGYYFVYRNLHKNTDLVKLGIIYKIVYSLLAIYFYLKGLAHVVFLWFAIFDVVFLILFVRFLRYAKKS